ncbi:MAG: ATP-binding protein [Bacteroidota bacterium]
MAKVLTRTIKSQTEHLLEVRDFVSTVARDFGFSDEESSKIVLAVDEACTNIIKHAYQFDPNKEISVSIRLNKGALEILIEDEGKSFNPLAIKPPNLKQHLQQYRRGGLGVYLIKTLMDEVEYNLTPGKKNIVRLTKYLPQNR